MYYMTQLLGNEPIKIKAPIRKVLCARMFLHHRCGEGRKNLETK